MDRILDLYILSTSRNKKYSFKLPVTLWVSGTKVQTEALVDSGATTNFIDTNLVQRNNLVTHKLASPYNVRNADGTLNKDGQIKSYVRAVMDIGTHRTTNYLFITNLGDKEMMIGYSYLHQHNPSINWRSGEWEFTRCPESCYRRARKNDDAEAEADELQLEMDLPWDNTLEDLGEECSTNPYINWVDMKDPFNFEQCRQTAEILDDKFDYDLEEDEDTADWEQHVPKWLHQFGDVFSKRKSEQMPERKPYDHPINFIEGISQEQGTLLPPAKVYSLSPIKCQALDT